MTGEEIMSEKRDDNTKDGGETEDEREENTLGRDWWYRVPLKHLLRVYDLMKRQGTTVRGRFRFSTKGMLPYLW